MNTVKLQDVKLAQRNFLHSYTLTMRKQKEKLKKQYHSSLQQQQKIGVYLPKETKDLYIENTDERNQRGHKEMEKYPTFMDQTNQYSEHKYTIQSNL